MSPGIAAVLAAADDDGAEPLRHTDMVDAALMQKEIPPVGTRNVRDVGPSRALVVRAIDAGKMLFPLVIPRAARAEIVVGCQ